MNIRCPVDLKTCRSVTILHLRSGPHRPPWSFAGVKYSPERPHWSCYKGATMPWRIAEPWSRSLAVAVNHHHDVGPDNLQPCFAAEEVLLVRCHPQPQGADLPGERNNCFIQPPRRPLLPREDQITTLLQTTASLESHCGKKGVLPKNY